MINLRTGQCTSQETGTVYPGNEATKDWFNPGSGYLFSTGTSQETDATKFRIQQRKQAQVQEMCLFFKKHKHSRLGFSLLLVQLKTTMQLKCI